MVKRDTNTETIRPAPLTMSITSGERCSLKLLLEKELQARGDMGQEYDANLRRVFGVLAGYEWNSPKHRIPELCQ